MQDFCRSRSKDIKVTADNGSYMTSAAHGVWTRVTVRKGLRSLERITGEFIAAVFASTRNERADDITARSTNGVG